MQGSSKTPVIPALGAIVLDRHNGPPGGEGLHGKVHDYILAEGIPHPQYLILRLPDDNGSDDGSVPQWTSPVGYCV